MYVSLQCTAYFTMKSSPFAASVRVVNRYSTFSLSAAADDDANAAAVNAIGYCRRRLPLSAHFISVLLTLVTVVGAASTVSKTSSSTKGGFNSMIL